jgi:hypothetical protein
MVIRIIFTSKTNNGVAISFSILFFEEILRIFLVFNLASLKFEALKNTWVYEIVRWWQVKILYLLLRKYAIPDIE